MVIESLLPSRHPHRILAPEPVAQTREHGLVFCVFWEAREGSRLTRSCSLEFNIRQLILTDLARNIGECKDHASEHDLTPAIDLVTSHVQTRDQTTQDVEDGEGEGEEEERIFMVRRFSSFHLRALA